MWIVDSPHSFISVDIEVLKDENCIIFKSKKDNNIILKVKHDHWIIFKVIACGLCGTDIASFHGNLPFDFPLSIGHEIVACNLDNPKKRFLIEINASHWSQYDNIRYFIDCPWCIATNEENNNNKDLDSILIPSSIHIHCNKRKTVGIDRLIGGTSPFIIIPKKSAIPIPMDCNLNSNILCLCEPLAAAIQAVVTTHFKENDNVAILGPKRLGVLLIAALSDIKLNSDKNHPISTINITAIHRREEPLEIAKYFGAENIVNTNNIDIDTLNGKYDVVFDCTGTKSGFEDSIKLSKRIVHLKSTCGSSCFNCKEWTSFVVDELSLIPWNGKEDPLQFSFSPLSKTIKDNYPIIPNRIFNIFCTKTVDLSLIEGLKEKYQNIKFHCLSPKEALNICLSEPNKNLPEWNSPFPRFDMGFISSLSEFDLVVRPDPINHIGVSLIQSRCPIILLSSRNSCNNVLENNILSRNISIRSSRCGNLHSSLKIISRNKLLAQKLKEKMISNEFSINDLPKAIQKASEPNCTKVILRHDLNNNN